MGIGGRTIACRAMLSTIVIAILLSASFSVKADKQDKEHVHEPSEQHKQNVERMLELMGVPELVDQAARDMIKLYSAKIDQSNSDGDLRVLVDAYQKDLENIIYPALNWNGLKTTYVYSYAKRLTPDEVRQASDFYASALGQKFVIVNSEAMPEIKSITNHLVESDVTAPLKKLASQLAEGLAQIQTLKSQKPKSQ